MRRETSPVRPGWRATVEGQGLAYAVARGGDGTERLYWDESAAYVVDVAEADELERVTEELHGMAVTAARRVLDDDRLWASLGLPAHARPTLRRSLDAAPDAGPAGGSLYGRLDLAFDGSGPPLLLEHNADTPTALVEASVVQWYWLEDLHPDCDQVNTLHERLVRAWQRMLPGHAGGLVHLAAGQTEPTEDWVTVAYLRDTVREAGFTDVGLRVEDLGWWEEGGRFVDLDGRVVDVCYRLYPWEWMFAERFGPLLDHPSARVRWVEPPWKALLASKTLLVALWQEFEGHPNLLPAWLDEPRPGTPEARRGYVSKPVYGWEGAGIRITAPGIDVTTDPAHTGGQALVHQAFTELADFDGNHPVIGSWLVAGEAAGLGFRESTSLVTDTAARFVPHRLDAPRSTPEQVASWLAD
ncbi:glutathionylspermidine synthase [Kineococcus radiotolerans]|uniref:Glutathionylspermidine synthase n=2 Tax=Kineococcus radiotolerans TaxID=131568 RepID=A6WBP0_KINRD|nr:glutathionylspermidine synthase family protein [Kineococcus radiotolerans]ABS04229.1 glutathionylspermidine synthase [Kineococcus radiotolerans SRS30216 = ATCC BAA-149]MBB2903484.1 glutathionylspermidine synthase [Kineococcus radiotolerans]